MAWGALWSGTVNFLRITALIILKILLFTLNLIFTGIKIGFFLLVTILTLGRLGMGTMDLGGRRR